MTTPDRTRSRQLTRIIDVHSHAIFADLGAQAPVAKLPAWSPEQALAQMDAHGVSACVLSIPHAANSADGRQASDIARRVNERLAQIVQRYPSRFGAVASLPGRSVDGCLEEMAYALDVLKLDGVTTTTNIDGVYLGDARFDPWFDEMNRRRVTLFIHPMDNPHSAPVDIGLNASLLEFMFDSTRMVTNMVFSGAKQRFADIRMISTHGGGTIPYLARRLETLAQIFGNGEGRQPLSADEIHAGFASFHYDITAAGSPAQLHALRQLVPASRLLMGLDYPFMPSWTRAPALEAVARWDGFSDADLVAVAHDNAARLYPALAQRIR